MNKGRCFYDRGALDTKRLAKTILSAIGDILALWQFLERLNALLTKVSIPLATVYDVVAICIGIVSTYFLIDGLKPSFWPSLKSRVWHKDFEAEIVGGKKFLWGQTVRFKAWFDGALSDGYFTVKTSNMDGKPLPEREGKDFVWWYDEKTYDKSTEKGRLRGQGPFRAEWDWKIPYRCPIGKYKALICVCDGTGEHIKEQEIPFDLGRTQS